MDADRWFGIEDNSINPWKHTGPRIGLIFTNVQCCVLCDQALLKML